MLAVFYLDKFSKMLRSFKLTTIAVGFLGIILPVSLGAVWLNSQPTQDDWAKEKIKELKQNSIFTTSTIVLNLKQGEEAKKDIMGDSKPDISIKRTAYGVQIIPISNGEEPFFTSKGFNGKHLWQEKQDLTHPFITYYGLKTDGKLVFSVGELNLDTPLSYTKFGDGGSQTFKIQLGSIISQLPKNAESLEFEYTIISPVNSPQLGQPIELGKPDANEINKK
jgi:hypothetical protein